MFKEDAKDFADYVVYEIVNDKVHDICVCKEYKAAEVIARTLAISDPMCDAYFITGVNNSGDMVFFGGWYECYQKDMKTGILKHSIC